MNRSILLVALLGLMAAPLSHAQEPTVCASVCTSEKEQCTKRASKMTELDDLPSVEEKNPFARVGGQGQVISVAARDAERKAAQRRESERYGACAASYKRCSSACAPAASPAADQALPAK